MDELIQQLQILYDNSITDQELRTNADYYIKQWIVSDDFIPMSISFLNGEVQYIPQFAVNIFHGFAGNIRYRLNSIDTTYRLTLMELTHKFILDYYKQESETGIVNLAILTLAEMELVFIESPEFPQFIETFDLSQHLSIVEQIFIEMSSIYDTNFFSQFSLYDFCTERYEQVVAIMIEILSSAPVDHMWLQCIVRGVKSFDNFSVFGFAFAKITEMISQINITDFTEIINSCTTLSPNCDEENEFMLQAMDLSIQIVNSLREFIITNKQEGKSIDIHFFDDFVLLLNILFEMRCFNFGDQELLFQFLHSLFSIEEPTCILSFIDLTNDYMHDFVERSSQFLSFLSNANEEFRQLSAELFILFITMVDNGFSFTDVAQAFNTVWVNCPDQCLSVIQTHETTSGVIAAISEIDPKQFSAELKNSVSEFIISLTIDPDDENVCLLILNFIEKIGINCHDFIPQFLEIIFNIFDINIETASRIFYLISERYHTELLSQLPELIQQFFQAMVNCELTSSLIPGLLIYLNDDPNQELFDSIGQYILNFFSQLVEEEDEDKLKYFLMKIGAILHKSFAKEGKFISPQIKAFISSVFESLHTILLPVIMGCENLKIQSIFTGISQFCFIHSIIPSLDHEIEDKFHFREWLIYLLETNQFQLCMIELFHFIPAVIPFELTSQYFASFDIHDPKGTKVVTKEMFTLIENGYADVYFNAFGDIVIRGFQENINDLQLDYSRPIIKSLLLDRPPEYNQAVIEALQYLIENEKLAAKLSNAAPKLIDAFQ